MKPVYNAFYQEDYNHVALDLLEDLRRLLPPQEHEALDRLVLSVYKEGLNDGIKFANWLEEL